MASQGFMVLLFMVVIIGLLGNVVDAKVDAIFVFGDSLVDVGNNNYLPLSQAKANHLPNGIDFPSPNSRTTTGRFTNGLIIPDMIGQ